MTQALVDETPLADALVVTKYASDLSVCMCLLSKSSHPRQRQACKASTATKFLSQLTQDDLLVCDLRRRFGIDDCA